MESEPEHDPSQTGYYIEFDDQTIIFSWYNSRIRTFKDSQFDHVEVTDENGEVSGIIMNREAIDYLFEQGFPYSYDPIVDRATEEWFVRAETKDLANLTPEMFND